MSNIVPIKTSPQPPNIDTIAERLAMIDEDIRSGYLLLLEKQVNELLSYKNIISEARNSKICKHYMESISKEQLADLDNLVFLMVIQDAFEGIDKIIELTTKVHKNSPEELAKIEKMEQFVTKSDFNWSTFYEKSVALRNVALLFYGKSLGADKKELLFIASSLWKLDKTFDYLEKLTLDG